MQQEQDQKLKKATTTTARESQRIHVDPLNEARNALHRAQINYHAVLQATGTQSSVLATGYGAQPWSPPYGTPSYGTPSYGTPSYGTPSYGTPSYGQAFTPYPALSGHFPGHQSLAQVGPSYSPLGNGIAMPPLPVCNIFDEGADFVCELEMPGVKASSIELQCAETSFAVLAVREPDNEAAIVLKFESSPLGTLRRTVTVPAPINPDGVTAVLRDGILIVTLPKTQPTQASRRIPVKN